MDRDAQLASKALDVQSIRIADLVQHKAFQVRQSLSEATVQRYARGFELEGAIADAPILVGRIGPPDRPTRGRPVERLKDIKVGALVLLAGFHRVAACERIGRETILARIVDTTAKEAQWLAAESNMAHGLPLKGAELRKAFHAFLRAGQYMNVDRTRKSLRDMARVFGKSHHTVHKWMNTREFHSLHAKYRPDESINKDRPIEEPIALSPEEDAMLSIDEALNQAANLTPALSPDQQERLVAMLERTLATVKGTMGANLMIPMDPPALVELEG